MVDDVIAMLVPGARLVIRTGLEDGSARARMTRGVDAFSRMVGWMKTGPECDPKRDALRARFKASGLQATFAPLYSRTPFNNELIVAQHPVWPEGCPQGGRY